MKKTNIELAMKCGATTKWYGTLPDGTNIFKGAEFNPAQLDAYTATVIEQATAELRHENANNKAAAELLKHALDKSEAMVAMLRDAVESDSKTYNIPLTAKLCEALNNSAKSAEAYEKRIKAEALEDAAKEFDRRAEQAGLAKLILAGVAEELRHMAAELKPEIKEI